MKLFLSIKCSNAFYAFWIHTLYPLPFPSLSSYSVHHHLSSSFTVLTSISSILYSTAFYLPSRFPPFSPILLYPFSSRLNIFPTNLSHFSSVSSSFPTLSRSTLSYPRRLHLCTVRHSISVRSGDHALLCEGGHQHFLGRICAHRESPVQRGGAELQDEHQHRSVRCDMMWCNVLCCD